MLAEQSIFFWRFSLDPENDENEHPNQEPKAKKMRTKSPNSRSMSQHMSDQARDGLEMRIGERKRAAEVILKKKCGSLKSLNDGLILGSIAECKCQSGEGCGGGKQSTGSARGGEENVAREVSKFFLFKKLI